MCLWISFTAFLNPHYLLSSLSWFLILASSLIELQVLWTPSSVLGPLFLYHTLFPLLSSFSFLFPSPHSLKSHLDYVFKNHLHAKDSKNYTSPQTTLLNSRLVCLTAYLTSFFPWISNRYFLKKHIQIRTCDLPSHSVPPAQPRYSVILLHVSKRYHYSPNCSGHKPLLILIFLLCSHF